jgi:hypothetical protein
MKNIHSQADTCKFHLNGPGVHYLRRIKVRMSNQQLMRQSVSTRIHNSLCKAAKFGDMANQGKQQCVTSHHPYAFTPFAILTLQSTRGYTSAATPQTKSPLKGNQDMCAGHVTQVMVLFAQDFVRVIVKHAVSKTLGRCYVATANRHLYRSRWLRRAINSPAF